MDPTSEAMERLNRQAWRSREAVRWYAQSEGFIDPGEELAFERVMADARDKPVLDLGIGGGRTTGHLLALTKNYVGVDYTPEMVEACRRRFAGVHFELADARELSRFATASFQLVLFSYNGIDAVDLAGRKQVMAEACRVLRPGGAFFFSTFNRNGPDFEGRHLSRSVDFTWNPLRLAARSFRFVVFNTVAAMRRLRYRRFEQNQAGHGILLHGAHDGLLVYAATASETRQQLAEAGFTGPVEVIGGQHREVLEGEFAKDEAHVHVIARKRATPQLEAASRTR